MCKLDENEKYISRYWKTSCCVFMYYNLDILYNMSLKILFITSHLFIPKIRLYFSIKALFAKVEIESVSHEAIKRHYSYKNNCRLLILKKL